MSDDKVKLARFSETVPAREHNTDNEELPPLPGCIWSPGPSLTVKRTFSPVCHGCLWAVALANDERQGETSHLLINEVDTRIWPGHATEIRAWHALRVRSDEEQRTVALSAFSRESQSPSAAIDHGPQDPLHLVSCWNNAARYHGLPTMSTVQQDPRIRQYSPLQQTLTLSPQLLFLSRPETSGSAQQSKSQDAKPVRWEHASYDQMRRQSVASNVSSRSSMSRRQDSGSPTRFSIESRGSPASSSGESTSSVSSHIADLSEMSAAPFCSSLTGIFGLTTECLACGYRYVSVHELADHQRMVHGMADVIF
ncbi:hypothetical protein BST61_g3435 [Cercospora zeina]